MSSSGRPPSARRLPLLALLPALFLGTQLGPALAQTSQTSPVQATPIQTTPLPVTPGQTTPSTTPVQTTPIQTTPLQVTPSQISPAPTAPVPSVTTPSTVVPVQTTSPVVQTQATPNFSFQDALAGLTASAQYRQLQLTLQAAQVQAQTAQAATGVTAGVSGSASYATGSSTDSTTGKVTDTSAVSASVVASASLPVLPWATANLSAQAAQRSYAVAQVSYAQNVAFLKTNLELAYGRTVTAQLNLSIAGNNLTLSQRQLAQVTAFRANNNATVQSVQTAQAAVQTAVVAVSSARNELDSARRALGTLVGRDLSAAVVNPDLRAAVSQVALPTQAAALAAAQAFSPLVASAQKAVTDAQVSLTTAERNRRLPSTTVSASYGPGSSSARTGLSAGLNVQTGLLSASYTQPILSGAASTAAGSSFALGLSASFNVLDPAADGALKLAQVGLEQAQVAVTVQQASVAQTLVDAYTAAQEAAASITARQSSVTAYTTALATSRARFTAGLATETEVLDAQIALAQAVRDLTSAQILALTTAAQLSGLTGLSGAP